MYRRRRKDLVAIVLGAASVAAVSGGVTALPAMLGMDESIAISVQVTLAGIIGGLATAAYFDARDARKRERRDPLTGLANGLAFDEALQQFLKEGPRRGTSVVALYGDLIRFKAVNDALGHDFGDALLVAVAERLRALIRPGDLVARLSGDEFAILARDLRHRREATRLIRRIEKAIAAPFNIGGETISVGMNVGCKWMEFRAPAAAMFKRKAERQMMQRKERDRAVRKLPPRDEERPIRPTRDDDPPVQPEKEIA